MAELRARFPLRTFSLPVMLAISALTLVAGFVAGRTFHADRSTDSAARAEAIAAEVRAAELRSREEAARRTASSLSPDEWEPLTTTDAPARLRLALSGNSQMGRIMEAIAVTAHLKPEEIPGVLQFADRLSTDERQVVIAGAVAVWAKKDPRAAAEWTKEWTETVHEKDGLFELCLAEWAEHDAVKAREWLDSLPEEERAGGMRGYLATIARENPLTALQEAGAQSESTRNAAYRAVFRTWGQTDPRSAGQAALQLKDAAEQRTATSEVVLGWVTQDPASALTWAGQITDERARRASVERALHEWARRDPEAAAARLIGSPELAGENLTRDLVLTLTHKDPSGAEQLAQRFPPGEARQEAFAGLAIALASRDPKRAVQMVDELDSADSVTRVEIASSWAAKDPAAAAAWVAEAPEGQFRREGFVRLTQQWADSDPVAAAGWIQQLPAGPSRDGAASSYASTVRRRDPARAMEWAMTISEEALRENTIKGAFESWKSNDATAAQQWLKSTSGIREDLRSVLQRER